MNLGELFDKYGSDKNRNGYTPVYHSLFKHIKNKNINLLEIGIGTMIPGVASSMVGYSLPGYKPGGSLRAWRDFFTKGDISGVDIQKDTQFTENRIKTYLYNSTETASTSKFKKVLGGKTFDIIIDDGSHWDEHQLKTLINFYPLLKDGGIYVIEDVCPGSRILTTFLKTVREASNNDYLFTTEKKNLVIISKELAKEPDNDDPESSETSTSETKTKSSKYAFPTNS